MSDDRSTASCADAAVRSPQLVRESAGPAGVRRSWAELIATLHGGIAVLDDDARVVAVSHGFLTATGLAPESVVGLDVADVFPNVATLASRAVLDRIARGALVGVGQRLVDAEGGLRWVRLTGVPTATAAPGIAAVLFVQDTTATSHAMTTRRRATLRLTEVEEQELERLRRQLHDGPIQLLAALNWRLSMIDASDEIESVRGRIDAVTSELRQVLTEFAPDDDLSAGARLERWIAPFVSGTPLDVTVEDHLRTPPNDDLTQAAFIFLYEMVRATRDLPMRRQQSVSIDGERGGYRLIFTTTTGGSTLTGATGAQYRAMVEYARSLGGSMQTEYSAGNLRTFSAWLPASADAAVGVDAEPVAPRRPTSIHSREWIRIAERPPPPELGDDGWEALVGVAPEPLNECDAQFRWVYVNSAYEELESAPAAEITSGDSLSSRFRPDEVAVLEPHMATLLTLEPVFFDLMRYNAEGVRRFVRVAVSPRTGSDGGFDGALVVLEDLSDLHHLGGLQASALDDLAQSRARARRASFERLRAPLMGLQRFVEQLATLEGSMPDHEVLTTIRRGLEDAVGRITRSIDLLAVPDLAAIDLGAALRSSLGSLLGDVVVDFVDGFGQRGGSSPALPADTAEALFRIAREAVVNAIIHGRAQRIEIELAEARGGVTLRVHNDGVPVDPAVLETTRDHLGVRLMVERARSRSGTCTIEPTARGGTLVEVWLPLGRV